MTEPTDPTPEEGNAPLAVTPPAELAGRLQARLGELQAVLETVRVALDADLNGAARPRWAVAILALLPALAVLAIAIGLLR